MNEEEISGKEIVYKTIGEVTLRLHVFEPPPQTQRPAPTLVFFFGGGWVTGQPKQFFPQCRYLASRGMVAVSAEYRVRDRHGTTPFESVADGKSAVRWLRAHADALGVDRHRVAAGGGSAGGHVAACTGIIPGYESPGADTSISSVPDGLALFNPAVDTTADRISERFEGRGAELSPIRYVRPDLPPAIIFHGKDDRTVPYAQVVRFRDAMVSAGNRCELVGFEGMGHGFFNHGRHDNVPFVKTMRALDAFLVALGFLTGEPTL